MKKDSLLFIAILIFFNFASSFKAHSQTVNWTCSPLSSTGNGHIQLNYQQGITLTVTFIVESSLQSSQLTFYRLSAADHSYNNINANPLIFNVSGFNLQPDGYLHAIVTIQIFAGGTLNKIASTLFNNGDQLSLNLANAANGSTQSFGSIPVDVTMPPITGNVICCSQCVSNLMAPNILSQVAGATLPGNLNSYKYLWLRSMDPNGDPKTFSSFSDLIDDPTYIPIIQPNKYIGDMDTMPSFSFGKNQLAQTQYFRRQVTSKVTGTTSLSNIVKLQDVPNATRAPFYGTTSYTQNTANVGIGLATINGTQSPVYNISQLTDPIVTFTSDRINVLPTPSGGSTTQTSLIAPITLTAINQCTLPPDPDRMITTTSITTSLDQMPVLSGIVSDEMFGFKEKVQQLSIFPNPCKGATTLKYSIRDEGQVTLTIRDTFGQSKILINNNNMSLGDHTLIIQTKELGIGVSICILVTAAYSEIQKIVVLE